MLHQHFTKDATWIRRRRLNEHKPLHLGIPFHQKHQYGVGMLTSKLVLETLIIPNVADLQMRCNIKIGKGLFLRSLHYSCP